MIDLRSDTVTKPTAEMRRAMAGAEVGDDVLDGDPTTRRLEERVAELLGKEAALFFPSGTMANQAALWVLGRRGTELVVDGESHIVRREMSAAAALSGLQLRVAGGAAGVMDAEGVRAALNAAPQNFPTPSVLAIENTHNGAGGRVMSLAALRDVASVARASGLAVHLDGARLWNASAATGTSLADFAASADTVMVSFSKGLGAPVGAALAATRDLVAQAHVARRRFGGAMRQSGVLAAAALHGLEHHLARIPEDHLNARTLAALVGGPGGARTLAPDTNIVMIDLPTGVASATIAARAKERGVLVSVWNPSRLRLVTHLDVTAADVQAAGAVLASVLADRT